ncbi:MAG: hypothetical protein ACREUO_02070 [Burkholderiales bacterium]
MALDRESVRDVSYDLRIWTVVNLFPAELAYERDGLAEPWHRLEQPLKPDTEYYWTVRARFSVDGNPRASEWSLSSVPCPPTYGFECARGMARRMGAIPALNHYRFKTPSR